VKVAWVQKSGVVNDQQFSLYLIRRSNEVLNLMAKWLRKDSWSYIMTSWKRENLQQASLTSIAKFLSLAGFIVQCRLKGDELVCNYCSVNGCGNNGGLESSSSTKLNPKGASPTNRKRIRAAQVTIAVIGMWSHGELAIAKISVLMDLSRGCWVLDVASVKYLNGNVNGKNPSIQP